MDRRNFVAATGAGLVFAVFHTPKSEADDNINSTFTFKANRFLENPVITVDMDQRLKNEADHYGYVNINGPSLIKVPDWVKNPLGNYYLYFAPSQRRIYQAGLCG